MAKMWAGRFGKETDCEVNDFNSSISFDCRLYREDIAGSMAHAAMLGKQGIITEEEAEQITAGLKGILEDIEAGKISFSREYEDIHMGIEQILTERIGDNGKRLHTARSRNDQVALDMRLYVKKEIGGIKKLVLEFMKALAGRAGEELKTVMPGYTHLQRAQPVTFAHYMMAYASMLKRDVIRLENCLEGMDDMPLGSGALASTTYPIDRDFVRKQLDFKRLTENSLDGVSDRDYCVELCSDLSILMMHLSRFSEEIIAWCSWEFKFIELDDAFSTGSSIMPQKKNPDVCELVRGKTGRVYGSLFTLLTALKGIPLAYNKDMQEDKEAVFDAVDTVKQCLKVITPMFLTMELCRDTMKKAALRGFINATDCADYLTKRGMPFRDAYKVVGTLVGKCVREEKTLMDLTLEELQGFSKLFEQDIYGAIDLETCVKERRVYGGPAPEEVSRQIKVIEKFLAESGRMSKPKVYIDGKEGTTGLQIYDRLAGREDIELLLIGEEKRKDVGERRKLINQADVVFLCLPDAAAKEAVLLAEKETVRFIDASTAHRTAAGWDYGLPELSPPHREAVMESKRVANPGCHATGFIVSVYPLVRMGILPEDYPLFAFSLTGYSGGGKKMIAEYESPEKPEAYCAPRIYGLNLKHKHLPEMQKVCGLKTPPVFCPVVDDYYKGMAVTVALHNDRLPSRPAAGEIRERLAQYYAGEKLITVHPFGCEEPMISAGGMAGKDSLSIFVNGRGSQTIITALFDNLGKGASGAAVQNMNLMFGWEETRGLNL